MDIKLIIEPSPGLQKFLDAFIATSGKVIASAAPLKAVKPDAAKTDDAAPAATDVTLEALRAIVAEKKSKRDGIKALLGKYGSPSISELATEHYAAFHAELLKL